MKKNVHLNLFVVLCLFLNLTSPIFAAQPATPTATTAAQLTIVDDNTAKVFRDRFRADADSRGLTITDYLGTTDINEKIGQATGVALAAPSTGTYYHRRDELFGKAGRDAQSAGTIDTMMSVVDESIVYEQSILIATGRDADACVLQFDVRVVTQVEGLATELAKLEDSPATYQVQQVQTLMAEAGTITESQVTVTNAEGESFAYDPRTASDFEIDNVTAIAAASCGSGCLIDCIKKHLGTLGILELICVGTGTIACGVLCATPAAPACPACIAEAITLCTGATAAAGLIACVIECLF